MNTRQNPVYAAAPPASEHPVGSGVGSGVESGFASDSGTPANPSPAGLPEKAAGRTVLAARSCAGPEPPEVLLLHGWGRDRTDLAGLGRLLTAGARVHLLDLPGFGESPHPGRDWSTGDYADYVRTYLDEHRIERAVIGGHSFGGRVAIRLAAQSPDRVSRVCLMAAAGLPARRSLRGRLRQRRIALLRAAARLLDRLGLPAPLAAFRARFGSADYRDAGDMRGILVRTVNEDLTEVARTVRCPALLLWGALDRETPPDIGERFADLIPDARLVVMPEKGHSLHAGMGAHLCAYYLLGWLPACSAVEEGT